MKITRDIVLDLLAVYLAGEASADTRALVDEYVRMDPELARLVREDQSSKLLQPVPLALQPDNEMKAFTRTRRAIYARDWLLFAALLFTFLAFGRIVSDTSFDVSPRHFIVVAAIAGVFWIAFIVRYVRRLAALR